MSRAPRLTRCNSQNWGTYPRTPKGAFPRRHRHPPMPSPAGGTNRFMYPGEWLSSAPKEFSAPARGIDQPKIRTVRGNPADRCSSQVVVCAHLRSRPLEPPGNKGKGCVRRLGARARHPRGGVASQTGVVPRPSTKGAPFDVLMGRPSVVCHRQPPGPAADLTFVWCCSPGFGTSTLRAALGRGMAAPGKRRERNLPPGLGGPGRMPWSFFGRPPLGPLPGPPPGRTRVGLAHSQKGLGEPGQRSRWSTTTTPCRPVMPR
ncbi:MAG: hypothetical protein CM15mP18_1360 [Methanobacteriota archaeon]|nr:MAG: hypothetical protein CM15mP18_1360 [Euryarchaeota archaeon]